MASKSSSSKGSGKKPIAIKKSREGSLHTALGVPQGKPIPAAKLEQALHSSNPALRKKAQFAKNAKGWNHSGSKQKKG